MKFYCKTIPVYFLFFAALSCTGDADFNQIEEVEIRQRFTSSFLFFDLDQSKFLNADASEEIAFISDRSIVDIFKPSYLNNNVVRIEFNFEINNSFERSFDLEFTFLDENANLTQTFFLTTDANSISTASISFEDADLELLINSVAVQVTANLLPDNDASILDINKDFRLNIESSVMFTLIID